MKFLLIVLILASIGCDRDAVQAVAPSATAAEATAVAVGPAEDAPAVVAADEAQPATQPTTAPAQSATIRIGEELFEFPAACARIEPSDAQTTILLYSDDPPDAINDEFQGNSFYLKMLVEPEAAANLPGTVWTFAADTRDRHDSPNGIFLDGVTQQLQPHDVRVEFEGGPAEPIAVIEGTFLRFKSRDEKLPPEDVLVSARLPLKIVPVRR